MLKTPPNSGSPSLEEVWEDKYRLAGDEEGVFITLREEGSPWSCRLDSETLDIIGELFETLTKKSVWSFHICFWERLAIFTRIPSSEGFLFSFSNSHMKKFELTFHYTEGGTIEIEAKSRLEAEKILNDKLDMIGIDSLKFDCCHRGWEIIE